MAELREVQKLVDMLHGMVDEAKSAPFSSDKCMIPRDEALDILEEISAALPVELKRAQELLRARDEYVESAKRDVERMMRQAELEAKSKVSESEVLAAARQKSHDIIKRAEDRSREMYRVANEYTEDALRRTEEAIQMALEEVKQSRASFRAASQEKLQQGREQLAESAKADKSDAE
ncbi:MAG: hypothetical protein ACI3W8_04065 [Oscillospiraceae bacterium]